MDAPENIATLIRVVTSRLFSSISDHTFPSATNASVAAYASSFIKSTSTAPTRNTTKEVLNCLRVLQRVLPVVFEAQGDSNTFESELLWKREPATGDGEPTIKPQFVIEDEDENDHEATSTPTTPKTKWLPSLGERLLTSITDLLFCCGFTLPKAIQVDHHKINYVIWYVIEFKIIRLAYHCSKREKGIGSTANLGNNTLLDSNRTEVLRLLLILLSQQIYAPAGSLSTKPSIFSLYIVQKIPRRDVLTILCSLLNTSINSSAPETITIGTIAGKLPYNHLVFKGEDPRMSLITISIQVLCVLLDFQSGDARDQIVDGQNPLPSAKTNTFRYFIMKLVS